MSSESRGAGGRTRPNKHKPNKPSPAVVRYLMGPSGSGDRVAASTLTACPSGSCSVRTSPQSVGCPDLWYPRPSRPCPSPPGGSPLCILNPQYAPRLPLLLPGVGSLFLAGKRGCPGPPPASLRRSWLPSPPSPAPLSWSWGHPCHNQHQGPRPRARPRRRGPPHLRRWLLQGAPLQLREWKEQSGSVRWSSSSP